MRLITTLFLALVVAIQYPLWFGRGGWLRTHEMQLQLDSEQQNNAKLRERNDKLAAEVKDLKEGAGAVEERARYELGMIKEGEVFVQLVDPPRTVGDAAAPTTSVAATSMSNPPTSDTKAVKGLSQPASTETSPAQSSSTKTP